MPITEDLFANDLVMLFLIFITNIQIAIILAIKRKLRVWKPGLSDSKAYILLNIHLNADLIAYD